MPLQLRRTLGFRDLVLFYLATTFSLRWIATAAAAGPSALVIWVFAALGLFVPLVFTVLELSSRYPDEGGMYVWSKRAFGPFAGFITGWTYWSANLPYFPGLLYFAAANALFVGGPSVQALSSNSTYFLIVSFIGLAVAVGLNIVGLNIGKWMTNISAVAGWVPVSLLLVFGFYSWMTYGSATPITARSLLPSTGFKDVIFWSTMAFAFGGVESASTMGDEIVERGEPCRELFLTAAVFITVIYCRDAVRPLARPGSGVRPPGVRGDPGDGGSGHPGSCQCWPRWSRPTRWRRRDGSRRHPSAVVAGIDRFPPRALLTCIPSGTPVALRSGRSLVYCVSWRRARQSAASRSACQHEHHRNIPSSCSGR